MKLEFDAIQYSIYPIMGKEYSNKDYIPVDLSSTNRDIQKITTDIELWTYISDWVKVNGGRLAYGGYGEKRNLYRKSTHFNQPGEIRNIHLAIDVWATPETPVYAPLDGTIHSFAYNDSHMDYGYTLILRHEVKGIEIHTLFGHLSQKYMSSWKTDKVIRAGDMIAETGNVEENGGWLPHLHFQLINDMEGMKGDYPGVCSENDKKRYLENCPNPTYWVTN